MNHARISLRALLLFLALAVAATACGSDPVDVTASDDATTPAAQADGEDTSDTPPPTTAPVDEPASEPTSEPVDEQEPASEPTADPGPSDVPDAAEPDTAPSDDTAEQADDAPEEEMPEPAPPVEEPAQGWQRVDSAVDLLGPNVVEPDELFVADDGVTVVVRFWTGVPPCTLARVSVAEGVDAVQVMLEVGANPDAATMTCIAIVEPFEIVATLAAPLGDRALNAAVGIEAPPANGPIGAVFSTDQYLGLTVADAKMLAEVEGRELRIAAVDGEYFALTQDFVETRVNIEVEDDIVVAAFGG